MGIDISCNMGFTKKLSNASTMTTIMADPNPSTLIPGKKFASKYTITAVTIKLIKILMISINLMLLLLHPDNYPQPAVVNTTCNAH